MKYVYEFEYEFEDFCGLSGIASAIAYLSGEFLDATETEPATEPTLDSLSIHIDGHRHRDLFRDDVADEFKDMVSAYFLDYEYGKFEGQYNG